MSKSANQSTESESDESYDMFSSNRTQFNYWATYENCDGDKMIVKDIIGERPTNSCIHVPGSTVIDWKKAINIYKDTIIKSGKATAINAARYYFHQKGILLPYSPHQVN